MVRLPWIDQKLVKGQLLEIEKWKLPNPIKPFISSTLTEECYIYIYKGFGKPINAKSYFELMIAGFKQHAVKIIENYPPDLSKSDQRDLTSVVATRWVFSCSNRNFLNQVISKSKSKQDYYQTAFDFSLDFPGYYLINHSKIKYHNDNFCIEQVGEISRTAIHMCVMAQTFHILCKYFIFLMHK